uniref:hypothetical protein n=1 Tax=Carboxylicivirga taeanensis TaxID=1416875 RepID=UPI003F6E2F53
TVGANLRVHMDKIIVILTVIMLTGCSNSGKPKQSDISKKKDSVVISKSLSLINISNDEEEIFASIINLLIADNYEIKDASEIDTLRFGKYKDLEQIENLEIYPSQYKSFKAINKTPIIQSDKDWFPKFYVFEIQLEDTIQAIEIENKLNSFIHHDDIFNEKNYDYVLRNHDRLIYVLCQSKMFEEYALSYKRRLKEIIKN